MRLSIFLLLFVISSENSAQITQDPNLKPYNRAMVWRGFSHLWSYNHRVNRLGSYVFLQGDTLPKGVQFSASGLGSDSTFYEQYYTYVESPNLRFYKGSINMMVTGRETQLLNESNVFSIYAPEWFRNLARYKTLINGFEIKSLEKADQPILFEMHLDDPFYSTQSKELKFSANVNWVGNCRSAECSIFKNTTTYMITIHYLIIGWEKDDAMALEFYSKNSYEWTINLERPYTPLKRSFQVIPNRYKKAFIGIKSLGFILNEEQWLQEMKYSTSIDNYNETIGIVDADIGMHFLGWKEGMKSHAVSKKEAMFAHKKAGWISMSLNSSIIQMNEGTIIEGQNTGRMFWPGKNFSASGNKASQETILKFEQ
jgi:hypothetical protein